MKMVDVKEDRVDWMIRSEDHGEKTTYSKKGKWCLSVCQALGTTGVHDPCI